MADSAFISLDFRTASHEVNKQQVTTAGEDEENKLLDAIAHEDLDEVRLFFKSHPQFGEQVERGHQRKALQLAIESNLPEILELLLQNNFNVGSFLFTAVREGSKECVEIILPYIRHDDQGPETISSGLFVSPLMLAVHLDHYDIIELFVEKGYKVHLDEDQNTGSSLFLNHHDDEVVDGQLELRKHRVLLSSLKRIHTYRALASPLYIAYSYLNNDDPHPLFQIFQLNNLLKEQGGIDFEFKQDYKNLSKKLQEFAVDLLEQCRTVREIEMMTDVNHEFQEELKKTQKNYVEVKSEGAEELIVMNLAIRSGNVELVAHPYSQLRLNEVLYRNIYKISPYETSWRQRGLLSRTWFSLRHTLLLPFLTLLFVFCPDSKIGKGMRSPVVKYLSHTGSFCMFVVLLMLASFQDKFNMSIAEPTILDWLILVWVFGLVVQEIKEFYLQGFRRYVNQWWNMISCLMLLLFVVSYLLSITAYVFSQTSRDSGVFDTIDFTLSAWYKMTLVANGLFSVAIVLSFVHLSSAFQVSAIFGPMQLSLYKILVDVFKFLIFFFTLFMAYGFSLRRLYSHYINTQNHLHRAVQTGIYNTTKSPDTEHAFSNVYHSLYSLFWAVFGMTDVSQFATKDKDFQITEITGEVLFGSFQILMVIIAVNMLIAMMSRSYEDVADNAHSQWRMSRTKMWMNWVDKGNVIPPPFNIFPSIKVVVKSFFYVLGWLKRRCVCGPNRDDTSAMELTEPQKISVTKREMIRRIVKRYLRKRKDDANQENFQRIQDIKEMIENMYKDTQKHFKPKSTTVSPLRRHRKLSKPTLGVMEVNANKLNTNV